MSNNDLVHADKAKLVSIDMAKVKEHVGDQLRAFLLNMMPQEVFDQVIESSWRNLTEPRPELDNYGRPKSGGQTRPSELEEMVTAEMRTQLKAKVADWGKEWRESDACADASKGLLKELVEIASGGFINRVAATIVQEAAGTIAEGGRPRMTICCGCNRNAFSGQQCPCGTWNG